MASSGTCRPRGSSPPQIELPVPDQLGCPENRHRFCPAAWPAFCAVCRLHRLVDVIASGTREAAEDEPVSIGDTSTMGSWLGDSTGLPLM
jgi:hypothetical protein